MTTCNNIMRWRLWLLCSAVLFWAGCAVSHEPTSRAELEEEFEMFFDFKPASDVADMQCRVVRVGDGVGKWLVFSCADATFRRITSGLTAVVREKIDAPELPPFTSENENHNAPKWWPKSWDGAETIYYVSKPFEAGVRHESMYLYVWRDKTTKKVFGHLVAWH